MTPTSTAPRAKKPVFPIRADEVVTSTAMVERLARDRGVSAVSARQQLARGARRGQIWRSSAFRLQGGGRLFAQLPHVGTAKFLHSIRPLVHRDRAGICRVLDEMLKQPAIHLNSVKKLLAASRLRRPAHGIPSFAAELRALEELGIGRLDETGGGAPRMVRPVLHDTDDSRKLGYSLAANALLDRQLTELLYHDFRKQNIVVWAPIPDAETEQYFNEQWFSAHGFSKLRPVMRYEKGKPPVSCATVFDVRANVAGLADVEAFLTRVRRAGDRPGSDLRILGVMGARYFEPEAFTLGKEQGLILVNFQQSIGDEALEALAAVDRILALAPGETPQGRQPDYGDLFRKLRHHPQVKAIAGLAFESFAACVLQAEGWSDAKTGLSVPFGHTSREIDVCVRRGDQFRLVECKAYASSKELPHEDIVKFFTETVPAFKKSMAQVRPVKALQAELWTTGLVTEDCRRTLEAVRERTAGAEVAIRNAAEIAVPNDVKSTRALLEGLGHL